MQFDTRQDTCCASDNSKNECSVPTNVQSGCGCASQAKSAVLLERPFSIEETNLLMTTKRAKANSTNGNELRRNIRGIVLLGIACITSPCCTPLIVPVILALLAGTPVAVWLAQNVGWVYSGLTLVSVTSMVLGLRWVWRKFALPTPVASLPHIATLRQSHSSTITLRQTGQQPKLPNPAQISAEK